jgi:hypothetical protein
MTNPFPGPRPYGADDRDRFFGRAALAEQLVNRVLSHPCTVVFGPSGAGKSSLMQAGVIPRLLEKPHDYRMVFVDVWPDGEAPLSWLVHELFANLELGTPPATKNVQEALDEALSLAELRSERPILIYLDQLEQILVPRRDEADTEALLDGIDRLANRPLRGLTVVLSLREDYLGRLRDQAQGRRELLEHEFRVPPLSVGEMVEAVCQVAAKGEPPQAWDEDKEEIRRLMREVRVSGEAPSDKAKVQAAFAQIVCRSLWETRIVGTGSEIREAKAEVILHRYLVDTLNMLGPLRELARQILEEHLIDKEGNRLLLTEQQASVLPGGAFEVLGVLERAAILQSRAHQGSRYFEIGHDWLAKKVCEQRRERERKWVNRGRRWVRRRPFAAAFVAWVVLFLMGMTGAAFSVAAYQESDRRDELLKTNVHMARAVAGAANSQLKDYRDDVAQAAANFPSEFMDALKRPDPHPVNKGPLRDYCKDVHKKYERRGGDKSLFVSWFILSTNGTYLARSEDPKNNVLGKKYNWRDYFQGAHKLSNDKVRSAHVSRAFVSQASDTERFAIAAPIYGTSGEWIGVITAMTDTGATLGPLSLHDRNDNRIIALAAPQDKEDEKDELPSDYVILVHSHLTPGARTPLSGVWVRDLVDRAEQSGPQTGIGQLRMADADVVKQDEHYIDPVKSDYAGQWLAGFAPVGHTGFVVIVQSREQEVRDSSTKLLERLAKSAAPAASPGVLLMIFAAWYESRRKAAARGASQLSPRSP